jgi:hypothetical protein
MKQEFSICSRCRRKTISSFCVNEMSYPGDVGVIVCSECCDPFVKSLIYAAAGVPELKH